MLDMQLADAIRHTPPVVRMGTTRLLPRPTRLPFLEDATLVSPEEIRRHYDQAKAEVEAERLSTLARRLFLAIRLMPTGISRSSLCRFAHPTDVYRCLSVMRNLGWVSVVEEGVGVHAEQMVYPGNVWREDIIDDSPVPDHAVHTTGKTLTLPEPLTVEEIEGSLR